MSLSLANSCKKLGYKLSEKDNKFTATPISRGMVLHFDSKEELAAWIRSEAQNQMNDFYLMEWGK